MKLLKLLRKKPFCNDFHFLLIGVILLLISIKYWPFYIVLGLYLVFLFLKTHILIPMLVIIMVFEGELFLWNYLHTVEVPEDIICYIDDVIDDSSYIVRYKAIKIRVSEKNHQNEVGNIIELSLSVSEIDKKSYEADFDYEQYLYSKGISYLAKGTTKEIRSKGFSIYTLKYKYLSYLEKHLSNDSYTYVKAMVFADNDLEDTIKDAYSILGISHILAVSGLHILFMYKIICFICLKLFHYYHKLIPIFIVTLFTLLIGAPASAMRALLFLVLGALNKKGEASYTRLDILSISCIFMLLLNPYQIYGSGFMLSYLVSFVLIFASDIVKKSGKLLGSYKTYYLIYGSTLPIASSFSNQISILSLLLSPVLTILVTFIILPVSYILSIFPVLDYYLKYVFILLNQYLTGLSSYSLFIPIPSFQIYTALAYYILFILVLLAIVRKRYLFASISALCLFIVCFIGLRYLNPYYRVTFIDAGQGDSCLIELPKGEGTILIDAFHSYDYLKSKGLSRIDMLILTHSDNDHIGDYKEILERFDVGMVYYPLYDTRLDELLEIKNKQGITNLATLKLKNTLIEVLGPINEYEEINSNSIVVKMKLDNTTFLFTGDMTIEEEKDLALLYKEQLKADVLKVGHHGSDTSSSDLFLSYVRPSVSIVSVGKRNSYGLPNGEVIERLNEISSVYMTKNCGNITFTMRNNKVWMSTFR